MASYGGVTFGVRVPDGFRPEWGEEERVVVNPVLLSNADDVQWLGLGTPTLVAPARVTSDADLTTLKAARGMTLRTLSDYCGATYSNVMLVKVADARRHVRGIWFCELTFMQGY